VLPDIHFKVNLESEVQSSKNGTDKKSYIEMRASEIINEMLSLSNQYQK
jgi:hypothetical protein